MRTSWLGALLVTTGALAAGVALSPLTGCGGSPAPESSPPPAATASAVEMLSSAEQSCESVQGKDVPVQCHMGIVDGVPAVVMAFADKDAADKNSETMSKRVGVPFCDSAEGLQAHARTVLMVNDEYRSYDCAKHQWSDWTHVSAVADGGAK